MALHAPLGRLPSAWSPLTAVRTRRAEPGQCLGGTRLKNCAKSRLGTGALGPQDASGGAQSSCIFVHTGVALGHEWLGVGGSFTEASAVTWRKLTERRRQEIITAYFHPSSGLGFNLGPTQKHVNLKVLASPWSPPSWMKTVKSFNGEGHLRSDCRDAWAKHFVRFVKEMSLAGVPIWGVSVQNEPEAAQCWEPLGFRARESGHVVYRTEQETFTNHNKPPRTALHLFFCDQFCRDAMPPTVHGSSALALEIVSELQRHGGRLMANHLFYGRPDLRKRMGDEKLLQFLQAFPHLVQIHERSGGHALEVVDLQLGPPTVGLGRAPSGALGGQGAPERGVHALRALERDLQNTLRAKRPEQHTQVRYLLHNGKLRRRIGAVVRFLPVPELIQVERMNGSPVNGVESEMPRGCPVSAHARTYAAYLLQFLRDRPGKFQLEHGGRQDSTPCANGDCCSCQFQVLLLPQDVLDEDTSFIDLLLLKIQQMMQKTGSQKVPLVRLGRDPQVQEALGGLRFQSWCRL
eukprot:g7190.t1